MTLILHITTIPFLLSVFFQTMEEEKSRHTSIEIHSKPPSYHSLIQTQPPPPTYIQSTIRLCYKNQPYISDQDQYNYSQQQLNNSSSNRLSYRDTKRCIMDYILSWATTLYGGKLIFLSFFALVSIVILGLIISFITIPSLIKHQHSQ